MLSFVLLFSSLAQAATPVVTFSYRALVGVSARVELPVTGQLAPFGEVGGSAWIVPGDDPVAQQGSLLLLRAHAKVGLDVGPVQGGWYAGPRVVAARMHGSNEVVSDELGLMATVGYKAQGATGRGTRTQLGVGAGLHAFRRRGPDPEVGLFPLPHVELRFGF